MAAMMRMTPLPDGTQKAVEVHVFEESLRVTGEGHYPWDLMPNSTMTNGVVAQQVPPMLSARADEVIE